MGRRDWAWVLWPLNRSALPSRQSLRAPLPATDEVASLARQLAQAVQEAGARENELREQLTQARDAANRMEAEAGKMRTELAEWKARPWWRRLAG
jgi:phage shock protein A